MKEQRLEGVTWAVLGAVFVAVVAAGLWSLVGAWSSPPNGDLPVLGEVPSFTLTDRSGRVMTEADLRGQPWVADFIFTHCTGLCPILSGRMARLQRAVREAGLPVKLVSFSVDPTRDTPDVLREYAGRFRADPENWLFLTGERGDLYRLIGHGFHLSVAERSPEEGGDSDDLITHSDRFVLVDGSLRIRGYYHGTEQDAVERVMEDLVRLGIRS